MLQKSFQRCRVLRRLAEENEQMSTGGVHKLETDPKNWQTLIQTLQNSALQCSYEQETDNPSDLEV